MWRGSLIQGEWGALGPGLWMLGLCGGWCSRSTADARLCRQFYARLLCLVDCQALVGGQSCRMLRAWLFGRCDWSTDMLVDCRYRTVLTPMTLPQQIHC